MKGMSETQAVPDAQEVRTRNGARLYQKGVSGNPEGRQGYRKAALDRELHRLLTRKEGRKVSVTEVAQALIDVACNTEHPRWHDAQRMIWDRVEGPVDAGVGSRSLPTIVLEVSAGVAASIQPRAVTTLDVQGESQAPQA